MIAATAFPCVSSAAAPSPVLRRRPSPHQGRALEMLGHAIEYLVDSRTALIDEPATKADAEALDILMRLSRSVFSECEEIVPVSQRLKAWMTKRSEPEIRTKYGVLSLRQAEGQNDPCLKEYGNPLQQKEK